jgi:hypothetical protein
MRLPPKEALAGEDALGAVGELLHHARHVADLAAAHPDVARRHVGVGPGGDRAPASGPGRSASLSFALALGIEVAAPLPPPMGRVVRAFLKVCSKARNFSTERSTEGWKRMPPLKGPMAELCCTR